MDLPAPRRRSARRRWCSRILGARAWTRHAMQTMKHIFIVSSTLPQSVLRVALAAMSQGVRGPEPRVVLAVRCRGARAGEGSRGATQSGEVFFPFEWASDPRAGLGGCGGGGMSRGVGEGEEVVVVVVMVVVMVEVVNMNVLADQRQLPVSVFTPC